MTRNRSVLLDTTMSNPTASSKSSVSWRRNLAVIWFTELVAIAGFTVVIPLLPLYLSELGVVGESATRIWAGLIFFGHAVMMGIFGPIWGALGDRYGRKIMVERAMFAGAVLISLMGLARNAPQLALLRMVQGGVTGTITAANALVATTTPRKRAGFALGLLQMAVYVGASVGPLLGGLVADSLGYRAAFWTTGALLFLSGLGVLTLVEDPFRRGVPLDRERTSIRTRNLTLRQRVWGRLSPILGLPSLLAVLGVNLLMRLGARLMVPVLPLFVQEIVPPGARVATINGLISGASALAGAVGALGLGGLGDRLGSRAILVASALVSVACYVPQYFVTETTSLLLLQAGTGLAMGGLLASLSAFLARVSPEGQEGIVYGVEASVTATANAIGPMTGSLLAAWLGLRAPFLVAAGIFGLAGVAAMRLLPGRSGSRGHEQPALL
jgi:DHA1 family multidrug resistance protein-like MFS transporter